MDLITYRKQSESLLQNITKQHEANSGQQFWIHERDFEDASQQVVDAYETLSEYRPSTIIHTKAVVPVEFVPAMTYAKHIARKMSAQEIVETLFPDFTDKTILESLQIATSDPDMKQRWVITVELPQEYTHNETIRFIAALAECYDHFYTKGVYAAVDASVVWIVTTP